MSLILTRFRSCGMLLQTNFSHKIIALRTVKNVDTVMNNTNEIDNAVPVASNKDRSAKISVATSIKYLKSDAYKTTYGNDPVWKTYVRNIRGHLPPKKNRVTCIRSKKITTASPCPICRDEYLVLHHTNVDLIKQFISPYNGEIISSIKTAICQKQEKRLLIAIHKAIDYGILTLDVPIREYNYSEWSPYQSNTKH